MNTFGPVLISESNPNVRFHPDLQIRSLAQEGAGVVRVEAVSHHLIFRIKRKALSVSDRLT